MASTRRAFRVGLDLGSVVHALVGFLVAYLDALVAIAVAEAYVAYQLLDFWSGEDAAETRGDLVEFIAGLVCGLLLRWGVWRAFL